MSDAPAFPPPPNGPRDRPVRTAAPPPPRTRPLLDDLVSPETDEAVRPDRRLGCVIPLAVLGLALTVGGASIVFDWWTKSGTISIYLLLVCVLGGPGFLLFARKVYSDPEV
jgi:hypothetical protein